MRNIGADAAEKVNVNEIRLTVDSDPDKRRKNRPKNVFVMMTQALRPYP